MNKTKIVLGAVVAVGAIYVGSSWYIGTKTESMIAKRVATINETLAQHITDENDSVHLEQVSYERGVFSSSAVYTLTVSTAKRSEEMHFSAHYSHGPFPIEALSAGVFSPMLNYSQIFLLNEVSGTKWYEVTNGAVPVQATSQVKFTGAVKSDVRFAALKVDSSKGTTLETSPVHLYADVGKDLRRVEGSLDIGWLTITDTQPARRLRFEEVRLEVERTEQDDGVVSGRYENRSKHLAFSSLAENITVVLDDTALSMTGTWRDELISSAVAKYELGAIQVNGHDFGSVVFGGELKNLDIKAEKALKQARVEFKDDPEALKGYVLDLLKNEPEVSISPLAWKNTGGESVINAMIAFQPIVDDSIPWAMIRNLSLNVSLSRRMVSAAIKPTEPFMRTMVDRIFDQGAQQYAALGVINYDRENASVDLNYDAVAGTVVLNGQAMSVEGFFALMKEAGLGKREQ
ncbi:YdgA family protein [Paenalcaligenes suwonensis]|uniref:YdgA family protein n=1 Tax=Paenalcaligenes suwonensis TaxID=1202713 RepID=UPI00140D1475|nr:YdgA family protein [Paenalcaligenes suwonensis]NHC61230.1 YdgA family protein [Paenalcaligenes suwonensis]